MLPGGSSLLHISSARDLASNQQFAALLNAEPDATTRVRVVEADEVDESIAAESEPVVVRGATSSWRAATRWSDVQALTDNYGSLCFALADGQRVSLADFLRYSAETTADFPYYISERAFGTPPPLQPGAYADLSNTGTTTALCMCMRACLVQ
jgi:hypothetical protein